jgi:ubiquinone biosynthesis monooxygenase Coq7
MLNPDRLIVEFDKGLRTLFGRPRSLRPHPDGMLNDAPLDDAAKAHAAALMTARRVNELGGRLSFLNPLWYSGSLAIGALAGLLGDRWNLGFLAETEKQVGRHLQSHLDRLPPEDEKSRAIVRQMYEDETNHADMATSLGGADLPAPVRMAMKLNSKVMTNVAYWI